jgi:hypothetical protein
MAVAAVRNVRLSNDARTFASKGRRRSSRSIVSHRQRLAVGAVCSGIVKSLAFVADDRE